MAEDLDLDRLNELVRDALGRPDATVGEMHALSGGASRQTWSLVAAAPDGLRRRLILRRDPPGLAAGAGDGVGAGPASGPASADGSGTTSLEVACLRAAAGAGVAVPGLLAHDEGPATLGAPFLLMDHVEGETIPRRILRDERFAVARSRLAGQCGEALARIHGIDRAEVAPAVSVDPLARIGLALEAIGDPHPVFELARRWLELHRPESAPESLVHGDFRSGNLIVDEDGLAAVIDWERAHWGDPVEDLGWLCVRAWRFGSPLEAGGFATVDALLDAYREAGGRPVDAGRFGWWLVFGTLDWGVICGVMAHRHLDQGLRSVELATIGRRAAAQEWDLLGLLAPRLAEGGDAGAAAGGGAAGGAAAGAGAARAAAQEAAAVGRSYSWAAPRPGPPGAPAPDPRGTRGPHDRPDPGELTGAVRDYLSDEVFGATSGRIQFLTRVAINALGIVERELALGPAHAARHAARLRALGAADDAQLAAAIRAGRWDDRLDALIAPLRAAVADKLAVDNPALLAAEAGDPAS